MPKSVSISSLYMEKYVTCIFYRDLQNFSTQCPLEEVDTPKTLKTVHNMKLEKKSYMFESCHVVRRLLKVRNEMLIPPKLFTNYLPS